MKPWNFVTSGKYKSHKIARYSLDFCADRSGTVSNRGGNMDRDQIEPAISAIVREMHNMLKEATRIAKAAEACAQAGSVAEGVAISMDIEQLVYEIGRLGDAASLLNRLSTE